MCASVAQSPQSGRWSEGTVCLPHKLHADLLALGLTVEPVTDADAERAAELIVAFKVTPGPGSLSLGDGLCIAVAERLGLPLTGGDRYWSRVPLQVEFLPFR